MKLFQLQHSEKCPTIDFSVGERAMIIKDRVGDWGVVVGRWDKFRKGIPGTDGRLRGSPFYYYRKNVAGRSHEVY